MVKQKKNQEKNDNMKNGRKNIRILHMNIRIIRAIIAIILFFMSIFALSIILVLFTFGMHYGTPPYRPKVE